MNRANDRALRHVPVEALRHQNPPYFNHMVIIHPVFVQSRHSHNNDKTKLGLLHFHPHQTACAVHVKVIFNINSKQHRQLCYKQFQLSPINSKH